jgi:hypothetical protein
MADAPDLGSGAARHGGSSPPSRIPIKSRLFRPARAGNWGRCGWIVAELWRFSIFAYAFGRTTMVGRSFLLVSASWSAASFSAASCIMPSSTIAYRRWTTRFGAEQGLGRDAADERQTAGVAPRRTCRPSSQSQSRRAPAPPLVAQMCDHISAQIIAHQISLPVHPRAIAYD